jgi:hypothetical protein
VPIVEGVQSGRCDEVHNPASAPGLGSPRTSAPGLSGRRCYFRLVPKFKFRNHGEKARGTHTHTLTNACTHEHTNARTHAHMHAHINVQTHTHTHTHSLAHTHGGTHSHALARTRSHTRSHARTHSLPRSHACTRGLARTHAGRRAQVYLDDAVAMESEKTADHYLHASSFSLHSLIPDFREVKERGAGLTGITVPNTKNKRTQNRERVAMRWNDRTGNRSKGAGSRK